MKNRVSILLMLSVLFIMIGGTFAWLNYRTKETALVLTISEVNGTMITLKPYKVNGVLPLTNDPTDGISVYVSVVNNKNEDETFNLYYNITSIAEDLKSDVFKYTIYKTGVTNPVKEGDFTGASDEEDFIIYTESVPANTTTPITYQVYLWLEDRDEPQSNLENLTFNAELRGSIVGIQSFDLYTLIADNSVLDNTSSTYVSSSTGIDFANKSSDTNGRGIYTISSTAGNTFPIYYYSGAVKNNNVLFGGYCWKIVRTTHTGGIKLIYNGLPDSNNYCGSDTTVSQDNATIGMVPFNSNYDLNDNTENFYLGAYYTNSTIKNYLANWYNGVEEWSSLDNPLKNYETNYLEDGEFCVDVTNDIIYDVDDFDYKEYFGSFESYNRVIEGSPNIACNGANANYYYSNVGLISSDEVMYAGNIGYGQDLNFYLFDNNRYSWTLSLAELGTATYVFLGSSLGSDNPRSTNNVRPVISLKPGLTYTGSGVYNDPYIPSGA